MFGLAQYNFPEFKKTQLAKHLVTRFGSAPEPGDRVPDFELRTIDGDKIRLGDFRGERNVLLTFGSATCPLTASSISGLDELYEDYKDDVEFLFVYVREAHPGEFMPAHHNMADKVSAAEMFRDEEDLDMTILVDELNGKVHRKYSGQPNPSFLIDKSGRVAFRQLATQPATLRRAIEELLERQEERGVDHAIVYGGEDTSMPALKPMLHAYRALERGGNKSIEDFRREMGMPGRMAVMGSRIAGPVANNPGTSLATAAAIVGVLGLGIWVGRELRRRRFENQPYRYPDYDRRRTESGFNDYEAVGI